MLAPTVTCSGQQMDTQRFVVLEHPAQQFTVRGRKGLFGIGESRTKNSVVEIICGASENSSIYPLKSKDKRLPHHQW